VPRWFPPVAPYPPGKFHAEQRTWQALNDLPDEAVVFAQYRVIDEGRVVREADFLVAWPHVGVAIIEVKGGRVFSKGGQWFSRDRFGGEHEIRDPIFQSQIFMYALRRFVAQEGGEWTGALPVVVAPDTAFPPNFHTADSMPEQWVDRDDLATLPEKLESALLAFRADDRQGNAADFALDAVKLEGLVAILEHRLPLAPPRREGEVADENAERVDAITRDQYSILRALRTNDRLVVNGGPGTGKTWLASEHARQETILGARVALLCYNRALAHFLRAEVDSWPVEQRPAYVGTLHSLALDWAGIEVPDRVPEGFWDTLPDRLEAAAAGRESSGRFDLLVVDEAQDIRTHWWESLLACLNDAQQGPIVAFRDDLQQVNQGGDLPFAAVAVDLEENVRNTPQIGALLEPLTGRESACRAPDGPEPVLVEADSVDSVMGTADHVVAELLATGQWSPGDIAVLTTKNRHPQHVAQLASLGPQAYSDLLVGDDVVAYSTVKSFKGLERPLVVLAVNGFHPDESPVDLLHVGMSRARHRLIIVADKGTLAAVDGGEDLLRALAA